MYSLENLPNCKLCTELSLTRTQVVVGDGFTDGPKIVFVGEAPGANEDIQGKPFVGRSGQILRKTLEALGFSEKDYYITNVVKCRPPENRDPKFEEAKNCFPYLQMQLEKFKPRIICSLGAHATKYLISNGDFENVNKKTISENRGNIVDIKLGGKSYKLMPCYHPAATIYNQKLRDTFVGDLEKLKEIVYPI
ncbi:MAG: uracil-DNA glycosylase [uncultured DHVE6 group euryarchaeote]|nr:MAG: uracil-DNA glycosylase [uncultured DHVE6 group euryarchaeote]